MKKIYVDANESIYDLTNKQSPHWYVQVNFEDGSSLYKSIPNDRNDKILHEEHVLDLFVRSYIAQRYQIDKAMYEVIGRDADGTQRHDYTVEIPNVIGHLPIEITKLSDSSEVHIAHRLRDTASKIIRKYNRNFFAFLPHTMQARDLDGLFEEAVKLPGIVIPDMGNNSEMKAYIDELKRNNVPYIRLVEDVTQIHTTSIKSQSLREALQEAISNKERKDYLTFKHEDMILVIDDKSLRFSREYIDQCAPLLEYYFMGSTFKEIYIVSRKSSPTGRKNAKHELMLTPIKCAWNRAVFNNLVYVINKLNQGETLPLRL